MKLYATVLLLAAVVFAVGWTSHSLMIQESGVGDGPTVEASVAGSPSRGGVRCSSEGPFLARVKKLAGPLKLSEAQLQEIDRLIVDVSARALEYEDSVRNLYVESRQSVRQVLTFEQNDLMGCLMEEEWHQRKEAKVAGVHDYGVTAGWDPDRLENVQQVIAEYEGSLADYFRTLYDSDQWPSHDEYAFAIGEVRSTRDRRLDEILGKDGVAQFWAGLRKNRGCSTSSCSSGKRSAPNLLP